MMRGARLTLPQLICGNAISSDLGTGQLIGLYSALKIQGKSPPTQIPKPTIPAITFQFESSIKFVPRGRPFSIAHITAVRIG
jgi:hypothetical protein